MISFRQRAADDVKTPAEGTVTPFADEAGNLCLMDAERNVTVLGKAVEPAALEVPAGATLVAPRIVGGFFNGVTFDEVTWSDAIAAREALGLPDGVGIVDALPDEDLFENRLVFFEGKLYRYVGTPGVDGHWTAEIDPEDIAAGAIDTAKFAAGIEPVTISTGTLPTVRSTSTIFHDGKLYRWNGSAYVATVPTSDLTGTVGAGQIAAGAIDVTKFASAIEPVTLVAGALPTTRLTNVITYGGKLYRWNGAAYVNSVAASDLTGTITSDQIAELAAAKIAGQITSTQITDGAVSTPKLAAGAVVADKIAAGSILASKIAVTGGSLFPDGQMQDAAWWDSSDGSVSGAGYRNPANGWYIDNNTVPDAVNFKGALLSWVAGANITGSTEEYIQVVTKTIGGVIAGETYEVKATLRNQSNRPSLRINIQFYKADGAAVSLHTVAVCTSLENFKQAAAQVVAPALATHYRIYFQLEGSTAPYSGSASVANITVRQAAGGTLLVDGSIAAQKIAAGAVTAEKIAADTITAAQIAAGAIGAAEIAAGAITASKLVVATGNLLPDPLFRDTAAWYAYSDGIYGAPPAQNAQGWYFEEANGNSNSNVVGNRYAVLWGERPGQNRTVRHDLLGDVYSNNCAPVSPGATYEVKTGIINNTNQNIIITVVWLDRNKNYVADSAVAYPPGTSGFRSAQVTPPANSGAMWARWQVYNAGGSTLAGVAVVGNPSLREVAGGTMIVDGAITATKIAADAVTAEKIAAGAVTTAELAAGAVTAEKIAADSITAGQIAAGAIGASEIAAQAITASKVAVVSANLVPDPNFSEDVMWEKHDDVSGLTGYLGTTGPGFYRDFGAGNTLIVGMKSVVLWSGWPGQNNSARHYLVAQPGYNRFPVSPGLVYELKAGLQNDTTQWAYAAIEWFNAGMGYMTGQLLSWAPGESGLKAAQAQAPDGAAWSRVIAFNQGGGGFNGVLRVGNLSAREAAGGTLLVDGAISAQKIAAGAVTTDKLLAGAVTAAKLASTNLITLTAQIADAVITGAKIGHLEVDTINVKYNSITDNSQSYAAGPSGVIPFDAWTTVHTHTINSTGAPLILGLSYQAAAVSSTPALMDVRIKRGGTVIYDGAAGGGYGGPTSFSTSISDTPPSGVHVYELQIFSKSQTYSDPYPVFWGQGTTSRMLMFTSAFKR